MKKICALLVLCGFAAFIAGCDKKAGTSSSTTTNASTTTTPDTSTTTTK